MVLAMQERTYSVDGAEVGPVTYWSGLINGRGVHRVLLNDQFARTRLTSFTVRAYDTYRFRIIGAQSLYAFRFSIDEHKMKVIAMDGAFVNPLDDLVDFIIVHSGERYDFLLTTHEK